ncbi:MAG: DNA-protecting protein DprA [Roseburia sp.]|nr:DNA-protecting protein DprA [Roseburia sp.]MCM1241756.1 DNA-protecting protein DprA [Roseburia sp.]
MGARNCSGYGRRMAELFGRELAQAGIGIISGMARGIDGIGQSAALTAGGYSLGVMGCGADICYPAENKSLYKALCIQGGVCSEYLPGTLPRNSLFPPRNRIISGLSDVVLVIEAKAKSGTLITVDMALEQGKEVYALPGRVTEALSEGCNHLIRQGAGVALSPQDMIRELAGENTDKTGDKNSSLALLSALQADLLEALTENPLSVEQIKERMLSKCGRRISTPELINELMHLAIAGWARQIGSGYFMKV